MNPSTKQDEMDQFMDDFLNGKYTPEPSEGSGHKVKVKGYQRPRAGVARTSSKRHVFQSPTEQGPPTLVKAPSSKTKNAMDPQAVLRMIEMHAHVNDTQGAEAFLHYNKDERVTPNPRIRKLVRGLSRRKMQSQNPAA